MIQSNEIQIILSTMKDGYSDFISRNSATLMNCRLLIINQASRFHKSLFDSNIVLIESPELGLAKSRNSGIENSNGEICLISDDDVSYLADAEKVILDAFAKAPDCSVIIFQIQCPDGHQFKKYRNSEAYVTKISAFKACSIEIAFRREDIICKAIRFDERFGLGAEYSLGEETIFLCDCLAKGLRIKYVPIPIVIHEKETSGALFTDEKIFARGAQICRIFPQLWPFVLLMFALKKRHLYEMGTLRFLKISITGAISFIHKRPK